ncbi:hypothetical protein DdX_11846 [Ditylenchus destructor]|uniref:Uncharacterized protein n=1 Tax=Ditylenchus destructor TaxID=166010 RepID=A0AAD4R403_9BILA|nr:hypothetical protein DdX_11846 [Ditylenchus destructor]
MVPNVFSCRDEAIDVSLAQIRAEREKLPFYVTHNETLAELCNFTSVLVKQMEDDYKKTPRIGKQPDIDASDPRSLFLRNWDENVDYMLMSISMDMEMWLPDDFADAKLFIDKACVSTSTTSPVKIALAMEKHHRGYLETIVEEGGETIIGILSAEMFLKTTKVIIFQSLCAAVHPDAKQSFPAINRSITKLLSSADGILLPKPTKEALNIRGWPVSYAASTNGII